MLKKYKFLRFNNPFNCLVFWILFCCSILNGFLTHNRPMFWFLVILINFIVALVAWWDDPKENDSNTVQRTNRLG